MIFFFFFLFILFEKKFFSSRVFKAEDLEILSVIGRGQYGVVRQVRHKELGEIMAMKVIIEKKYKPFSNIEKKSKNKGNRIFSRWACDQTNSFRINNFENKSMSTNRLFLWGLRCGYKLIYFFFFFFWLTWDLTQIFNNNNS